MQVEGYLIDDRIVVFDINKARELYSKSYFGKPLGKSKPKSQEDINTPLELSLIEGLYLVKKGILEVIDKNKNKIDLNELIKYAEKTVNNFSAMYAVYEDLRNKGFIVRSGIKFGADYSVYTLGPGIEHAPYLVIVVNDNKIEPNLLTGFGRVSHSTKKTLILAFVDQKSRNIRYIMFKWVRL
jgi:tRNA-intron endonuclease